MSSRLAVFSLIFINCLWLNLATSDDSSFSFFTWLSSAVTKVTNSVFTCWSLIGFAAGVAAFSASFLSL